MHYQLTHQTCYQYFEDVPQGYNEARLRPRDLPWQTCTAFRLEIAPTPESISGRRDFFGNYVEWFSVVENHQELIVKAMSEVEVRRPAIQPEEAKYALTVAEARQLMGHPIAYWAERQFLLPSPLIPLLGDLKRYAAPIFRPDRPLIAALQALNQRIFQDFEFNPEATQVTTPLLDVLQAKKGVCQDFAQIGIGCLRAMGIPARYVSGYLETLPPPGQPKLQGADASHAWVAAFVPTVGWVDFDPTNNLWVGDRHITVAWGRDYTDVAPLKGVVFSGSGHDLTVAVDVARVS